MKTHLVAIFLLSLALPAPANDVALAALDREVARLYALATGPHSGRHAETVRREQREWLARRQACSRERQPGQCARDQLLRRIALLRATSKPARMEDEQGISSGPYAWRCEKTQGLVITTYADAEPPLVWLTRQGKSFALQGERESGATRFAGGGARMWEEKGVAMFQASRSAPAEKCLPEKIA